MRTFLADFDHQQRFGRNPPIIQLGPIHGSLWCYRASKPKEIREETQPPPHLVSKLVLYIFIPRLRGGGAQEMTIVGTAATDADEELAVEGEVVVITVRM